MLTQRMMLEVIEHERGYGGVRQHFFGQPSMPPRPRHYATMRANVRVVKNERGDIRTYSVKRDRYEWVKLIRLR